ncbi:MAG: DNA cytosine methyltransferase [Coriobacteriaceae bacterium]|jgi:DNA (cytosine-5)-methyltransferase 1|nr:DNA cytosine methyltransferase [Coriobacteriaceae bacterium]
MYQQETVIQGAFGNEWLQNETLMRKMMSKSAYLHKEPNETLRSIEICAGAGGQALGLEQAGFSPVALIEVDHLACETLRKNRPEWNVIESDVNAFTVRNYQNIDLLAGGVPCPPFSIAGKQLGQADDRDLFPSALRLVQECHPKAVMLENVRGLFSAKFDSYRKDIGERLTRLGYECFWQLIEASNYGVPQRRTRSVLVAVRHEYAPFFRWPTENAVPPHTVGDVLLPMMKNNGWEGAESWAKNANGLAPTIVGGSKKHGGADLGPTRARMAWEKMGVDGRGIADEPPVRGFQGNPRLTVQMAGILQGFPPEWEFAGKKTPAYRQVGNAFPPPVAKAIGAAIRGAIEAAHTTSYEKRAG